MRFSLIAVMVFALTALKGQPSQMPVSDFSRLSAAASLYLVTGNDYQLFYPDHTGRVAALVQLQDAAVGIPGGFMTEGVFGDIVSIRINSSELKLLAKEPNIRFVDVACRLNRVKLLNDTTRIVSQVNEVQNGISNGLPLNYRGSGVVVGIVDIGFQPDNPTNYSADGSLYRVKRFWHQSEKSGTPPSGFSYGTEYTTSNAIKAARNDDGTHATHVTGIAAGSGFTTPGNKYRGMAPESDLVFVAIKYGNDSLGGSALGDYVVANPNILDAVKYIFDYAESVGKPAVINLSWGMHTGPHDGNSLFDRAIENLTGPGKIFVGASGNDAANQIHIGKDLHGDTVYSFALDRSREHYVHENVYLSIWGDSAKDLSVNLSLFDTLGNLKLVTPFYPHTLATAVKTFVVAGKDTLWYTISASKKYPNNGKPEFLVFAESNSALNSRIRLGVSGHGMFHAWNSGQVYRWTSGSFLAKVKGNDQTGVYLDGTELFCMGENGGTGKATISAGAYIARKDWKDTTGKYHASNWLNIGQIADFSSRGPTTDGRIKPDIAAPGQNIISAINYRQFEPWMLDVMPYSSVFGAHSQYWVIFSGTSMAAPHVTGIVALMLQVNPNMTPQQVRAILQQTAKRDAYTGPDSNVRYGFGKINAFDAVKRLVQLNVKDPGKKGLKCVVYPIPAEDVALFSAGLFAGLEGKLRVTDIGGRLVVEEDMRFDAEGIYPFRVSAIAAGTYQWEIRCRGNVVAGKLMVAH